MTNASQSDGSATWLSVAFDTIQHSTHLNDDLYDVLRAFGKDDNDAPGPANLDPDSLDADVGAADGTINAISHLQKRIATELLDEIDSDQASMFSRRFVSVSSLLLNDEAKDDNKVTTDQLLRLALHRRTVQILSTLDSVLSKRKALRIRALVDFIWSQSLVLNLKKSSFNDQRPTLIQLASEQGKKSSSNEFSPGFYHSTTEGTTSDFGPVHINILRINLKSSSCRMKCIDARNTSTDLSTLAEKMGAVAAISGGFFLYSEPDIALPSKRTDPVGLLVTDGEVLGPPVFRRAAIAQQKTSGQNDERRIMLSRIGMDGVTCICSWGGQLSGTLQLAVDIDGTEGVTCIHRGISEEVMLEDRQCAFAIVGNIVVERKKARGVQIKMAVPLAGFVLTFSEDNLPPGSTIMNDNDMDIHVSYKFLSPHDCLENAIAGGPMFFSDEDECHAMELSSEDFAGSAPPVTFSQDETHDHNLLPRMGVGIATCPDSGDKQLVCVAVDGRNLDRALGLTLQGTSDLLRSLGCHKAMNLDGGSSKRMVIWDQGLKKHKVVCLSTTEIKASNGENGKYSGNNTAAEPSRPVHTAILFLRGKDNN
ncbi:hypothetical protein HJC23_012853 [Cyclotella cryptica]|uniref:Phosphodiester glycosidase domain-containing protein n=1 Tax=Cyclotella cryptica TaxID=29204 RepID=A0ABD3Q3C7_9STRA|eukprot:CCRYP_009424-RA/>CCRYP_009424-RA protein AED:0.34 eAED:0.34 QI:0/-1/0/1/-1/1/1/0/592